MWTLTSLNLNKNIVPNRGQPKIKQMTNSVDPYEMAQYECFHLGLHGLQRSSGLKGLTFTTFWANSADDKLIIFLLFFSKNRH